MPCSTAFHSEIRYLQWCNSTSRLMHIQQQQQNSTYKRIWAFIHTNTHKIHVIKFITQTIVVFIAWNVPRSKYGCFCCKNHSQIRSITFVCVCVCDSFVLAYFLCQYFIIKFTLKSIDCIMWMMCLVVVLWWFNANIHFKSSLNFPCFYYLSISLFGRSSIWSSFLWFFFSGCNWNVNDLPRGEKNEWNWMKVQL